jgi:DNA-binding FadR family transcriptional regulator
VDALREYVGRLRAAGSLTERRRADARIHIEIAAVAQSPRLTREEMNLWSEVGDLVWLPVTGSQVARVTSEHDELVDAIGRQDGDQARLLAEQHVLDETRRLLDLRLALE